MISFLTTPALVRAFGKEARCKNVVLAVREKLYRKVMNCVNPSSGPMAFSRLIPKLADDEHKTFISASVDRSD